MYFLVELGEVRSIISSKMASAFLRISFSSGEISPSKSSNRRAFSSLLVFLAAK